MRILIFFLITFFAPLNFMFAGTLIEVCGIDGSGKSTFIKDLYSSLLIQNKKVIVITPLRGDPKCYAFLNSMDDLKINASNEEISKRIEQFKAIFFLLSFVNQKYVINDLLQKYDYVISDRYLFSFRTYQEAFDQYFLQDEAILAELPKADITFFVDVPIDICIQRLNKREHLDFYENFDFLKNAQNIFHKNLDNYTNLIFINGEVEREQNIKRALEQLGENFKKK